MVADIRFGAGSHKMLDRIIGVRFDKPKGLLVLPHSVANPTGWGRPFTDLAGNPLVPGTPGGDNPQNVFRRRRAADPPPSALARGQDFRLFEKSQICDWRGLETEAGRGDQPILHFHGPPARYFPTVIGSVDNTALLYEPFFYDRGGSLKVPGPTAVAALSNDIKGVAKRNVGESNQEYICIIGTPYSSGGLEIHAKGVAASEDWRHLGTVGPFPQLGESGFANFVLGTRWDVPVHFNRLGTKCVTICVGLNDAPADRDEDRAFRLEISIDGDTVTDSGLVDVTIGSTESTIRKNLTEATGESTDVDDLPDCPTNGTFNTTTTSVFDEETSTVRTDGPTIIAVDYKIDTDDELGTISVTHTLTLTRKTTGGGTISVNSLACNSGGFPVGVAGSGNGGGTIVITSNIADDSQIEWAMDGGRHSATVSLFAANSFKVDVTTVETRVTTVTNSVGTTTTSQDRTLNIPEDEWINNLPQGFAPARIEPVFADIRYGSMILQNRYMQPEGFTFSPNPFEYPGISGTEGAQDTGPMKNPRLGGSPGDVQTGGLVFPGSSPAFAGWANNTSFTHEVFIESEDFSLVIRDHDTAYTFGHAIGGGGVKNNIMQLQTGGLFFVNPIFVPFGTDEIIDTSDSDFVPIVLRPPGRHVHTLDQSMWAAHDRHGSFLYNISRAGGDFNGATPSNGIPDYAPDFSFVSHADYGFEDPVDRVGMPPDSVNTPVSAGGTGDTDAPKFSPVVCV